MIKVQTPVTFAVNISLSFCETYNDAHTLPPQISCVTFLDKQRPWRMLQVCADNVQCVFVREHLCTQYLQLCAAEEGSHKMMGISKLGCSC